MVMAVSPLSGAQTFGGGRGLVEHDKCPSTAGRLRAVCRPWMLISDQYGQKKLPARSWRLGEAGCLWGHGRAGAGEISVKFCSALKSRGATHRSEEGNPAPGRDMWPGAQVRRFQRRNPARLLERRSGQRCIWRRCLG